MNLAEILAKLKADPSYDPSADLQALQATAINDATQKLADKNQELLSKLATQKVVMDTLPEDFTAEKWAEMAQSLKDIDVSKLKTDEAVEAVKTQLSIAHKAETDAHTKTVEGLTATLEKHMLDGAATAAIIEAGGSPSLLLPHVKMQMKMVQNDAGEYEVSVIDPKGQQRFSTENPGSYMAIPELVTELKGQDAYKPAFSADNSGGGAHRPGANDSTVNPWVKGPSFNMTEQAKIANANPSKANSMQEAAKAVNASAAA